VEAFGNLICFAEMSEWYHMVLMVKIVHVIFGKEMKDGKKRMR